MGRLPAGWLGSAREAGLLGATALLMLVLLAGHATGAGSTGVGVTDVKLVAAGERTQLQLALTGEATYEAFGLAAPYRLVVDLPNVEFHLHEDGGPKPKGLVSQLRFGLFAPSQSRMVLHIAGPFVIERQAIKKRGAGAVLEIDIRRSDESAFLKSTVQPAESVASELALTSVPMPKPGDSRRVKRVVIVDAGHGGLDSGAVSPVGTKEKHVVLAMAKAVHDKLVATGRYKVRMTRDGDYFVTLNGRIEFARKNNANLFVSIHADSAVDGRYASAKGLSVYTRSEQASSREAELLAMKENASDEVAGVKLTQDSESEVPNILMDLAKADTRIDSKKFAEVLLQGLKSSTSFVPKPNRHAAFYVLKSPDFPSILIELGFISNRDDEQSLKSEEWRDKISTRIVNGIDRFFERQRSEMPFE